MSIWTDLLGAELPSWSNLRSAVESKDLQYATLAEPPVEQFDPLGVCLTYDEVEANFNLAAAFGSTISSPSTEHPSRDEINAQRLWDPGRTPTDIPEHVTANEATWASPLGVEITWNESTTFPSWASGQVEVEIQRATNSGSFAFHFAKDFDPDMKNAHVDQDNVVSGNDYHYRLRYRNKLNTAQVTNWTATVSVYNVGAGVFRAGSSQGADPYTSTQIDVWAAGAQGGSGEYEYRLSVNGSWTAWMPVPSFLVGSLTANTAYTFQWEARDKVSLDTVLYDAMNATTLHFPKLTSASAVGDQGANSVQPAWTSEWNVEVAQVEVYVNSAYVRMDAYATVENTSDGGDPEMLSGGDACYFVITPVGKNGEAGTPITTNEVVLDEDFITPDPPYQLTAFPHATIAYLIELAWQDANTGEQAPDGWHVYVDGVKVDSTTSRSYAYAAGELREYDFNVTAYNSAGESGFSNTASATPDDQTS